MDILLAPTYFLDHDPGERKIMKPYPPLGLLYISSYLKQQGFQVTVFDTTFSTLDAFARFVAENRPPIAGLYCTLMTRQDALGMIRICRSAGCRTVVGGPEPAVHAAKYLSFGADAVVKGEGELTLAELIPALTQGGDLRSIRGLVLLDSAGNLIETGSREFISDLDPLPFPDRSATDLDKYLEVWRRHHGYASVSLITSRGCPYKCTWCSHSVFGYSHRRRSPENVADEIEQIVKRYRPDRLWYADDVFPMHQRWLTSFSDVLKDRRLRIPFETITREDHLNDEVIEILAEMGCERLWIGAESGSQRMLDAMNRRTDASRMQKLTRQVKGRGINLGTFIMLGYEGETREDIEATIAHLKLADPDIFLTTVAYPIKGTPYYDSIASKIVDPGPWETTTDRALKIAGRHSQRYYRHAVRWINGEVGRHRAWGQAKRNYGAAAKAWVRSVAGRLGMWMTRKETEEA